MSSDNMREVRDQSMAELRAYAYRPMPYQQEFFRQRAVCVPRPGREYAQNLEIVDRAVHGESIISVVPTERDRRNKLRALCQYFDALAPDIRYIAGMNNHTITVLPSGGRITVMTTNDPEERWLGMSPEVRETVIAMRVGGTERRLLTHDRFETFSNQCTVLTERKRLARFTELRAAGKRLGEINEILEQEGFPETSGPGVLPCPTTHHEIVRAGKGARRMIEKGEITP